MSIIADRISRIEESTTLKIAARAKAMRAEGIDVVDFSVGEPDFNTPDNIKEAAKRAIDENFTGYTASDGILELRKAIVERYREDHGLEYETNQVIVSCGAKHSLYNTAIALFNKGEEMIIPAPYWVSYPAMASLAKANGVIVPTREENGFRLTAEELKAQVNVNTKALMLNNPSNPTGSAYSREELEAIAQVVLEEGLYVIADEIYEKIVYDDFRFTPFASLSEEIQQRTVTINGVSKAYSMTGWRIGYALAPREIIAAMSKVQSHSTSNATSVAQMAGLEAIAGPQQEVGKMVAQFQQRRNFLLDRMSAIPGISCHKPEGAFYLFPNVRSYFGTEHGGMVIRNAYGLAHYLLKQARVAVVPGEAFGGPDNIRLSYASSMENLEKGIDRIAEALSKLKPTRASRKVKLDNCFTSVHQRVTPRVDLADGMRDGMVAEAEEHLPHHNYFEWNANIGGVILQLRTNVRHLYDFWMENWYPALIESDIEPHGVIYAVDGVPGREPSAYYHPESRTALVFNSAYYGQCKSLALGMVADISERLLDVHGVYGACVDIGGEGTLLLGAKGSGRRRHFYRLLEQDDVSFVTEDWLNVRYRGGRAQADNVERKVYLKTRRALEYPNFARLFESSRCENVVMKRAYCEDHQCQMGECALDHGEPFCFHGSTYSRVMVDPVWFGGPSKYVRRTALERVVLLTNDQKSPPVSRIDADEALTLMNASSGASAGLSSASPLDTSSYFTRHPVVHVGALATAPSRTDGAGPPFFNPHLLVSRPERLETQERYFRYLLRLVPCFLVNSGAGPEETVQARVRELVRGK